MVKWIGATWKRSFSVNDKHLLFECLLSSQDKYHTPAVEILIVFQVQNITAPRRGMGHVLVGDDADIWTFSFYIQLQFTQEFHYVTHGAHASFHRNSQDAKTRRVEKPNSYSVKMFRVFLSEGGCSCEFRFPCHCQSQYTKLFCLNYLNVLLLLLIELCCVCVVCTVFFPNNILRPITCYYTKWWICNVCNAKTRVVGILFLRGKKNLNVRDSPRTISFSNNTLPWHGTGARINKIADGLRTVGTLCH